MPQNPKKETGSYILLFVLFSPKTIQIGALGEKKFEKGFYCYVGSAMNGLDARIARHCSTHKKMHWHIDYLLAEGKMLRVFRYPFSTKKECKIAQTIQKMEKSFCPIPRFGSSDCCCNTHLFFFKENPEKMVENLSF